MNGASVQAIILASGSPTRRHMLEQAGLAFSVDVPNIDEAGIKAAMKAQAATAGDVALALAEFKGQRIAARHLQSYIIAADQMLVLDDLWFDKARDRADAARQLEMLSGKSHRLVSAVMVFHQGQRIWHSLDEATLTLRPLSAGFIDSYLERAGAAALGNVGCYAIEGLGAQLFERVEGDFFTIQGLPLLPLLSFLRDHGLVAR